MGLSAANEYLHRIADWQREHGTTGAPPVAFDKKLSNWIQFCRTVARRGQLNPRIASAFAALGISIERGPTDTSAASRDSYSGPRGFVPVLRAALVYVEQHGHAPSLRSDNLRVRHQAAWLIRLQAGILPANSFGFTAPIEDQLLPESVLLLVERMQTSHDIVAEWLLWCARAQCALDRSAPGNNWQETTYFCSHKFLLRRHSALLDMSDYVRSGGSVLLSDIPDPEHYGATLSQHVSRVRNPAKRVQFTRPSLYGRPLMQAISAVAISTPSQSQASLPHVHSEGRTH